MAQVARRSAKCDSVEYQWPDDLASTPDGSKVRIVAAGCGAAELEGTFEAAYTNAPASVGEALLWVRKGLHTTRGMLP